MKRATDAYTFGRGVKQCAFARYRRLEKLPNFTLGLTPQAYASTRFAGCYLPLDQSVLQFGYDKLKLIGH